MAALTLHHDQPPVNWYSTRTPTAVPSLVMVSVPVKGGWKLELTSPIAAPPVT